LDLIFPLHLPDLNETQSWLDQLSQEIAQIMWQDSVANTPDVFYPRLLDALENDIKISAEPWSGDETGLHFSLDRLSLRRWPTAERIQQRVDLLARVEQGDVEAARWDNMHIVRRAFEYGIAHREDRSIGERIWYNARKGAFFG